MKNAVMSVIFYLLLFYFHFISFEWGLGTLPNRVRGFTNLLNQSFASHPMKILYGQYPEQFLAQHLRYVGISDPLFEG